MDSAEETKKTPRIQISCIDDTKMEQLPLVEKHSSISKVQPEIENSEKIQSEDKSCSRIYNGISYLKQNVSAATTERFHAAKKFIHHSTNNFVDQMFQNKFQYCATLHNERTKGRKKLDEEVKKFYQEEIGKSIEYLQFKELEDITSNEGGASFDFKSISKMKFNQIIRNVNMMKSKHHKAVEETKEKEYLDIIKSLNFDDYLDHRNQYGKNEDYEKLNQKLLTKQDLQTIFYSQDEEENSKQDQEMTYFTKPHMIPMKNQVSIDQLMEQRKYRLDRNYIIDNVIDDKKHGESMQCIKCKVCRGDVVKNQNQNKNDGDQKEKGKPKNEAWTANKKAYICFDCFPDQTDWKRLQTQRNANEAEYPQYFSQDNSRLYSVLNNNQGTIKYKKSVQSKGSHYNAFQKPWQLEMTSKKRLIPSKYEQEMSILDQDVEEDKEKENSFEPLRWHEFLADPNLITFAPFDNLFAKRIKTAQIEEHEQCRKQELRRQATRITPLYSEKQKEKTKNPQKYTHFYQLMYIHTNSDEPQQNYGKQRSLKQEEKQEHKDFKIYFFFVDIYTLNNFLKDRNKDISQYIHPELHFCQSSYNLEFGFGKHDHDQSEKEAKDLVLEELAADNKKKQTESASGEPSNSINTDRSQMSHLGLADQDEDLQHEILQKSDNSERVEEIKDSRNKIKSLTENSPLSSDFLSVGSGVGIKNQKTFQQNKFELHKVPNQTDNIKEEKKNFKRNDGSHKYKQTQNRPMKIKKVIEPYKDYQQMWFFPSSEVFIQEEERPKNDKVQNDHVEENLYRIYKQRMMICFRIQQELLEVYEIEITWHKDLPVSLDVVNKKWVLNVDARSVCPCVTTYDCFNGFVIMDAHTDRWIKFQQTKAYEYAFQNNITFSTYKRFYDKTEKCLTQEHHKQINEGEANSDSSCNIEERSVINSSSESDSDLHDDELDMNALEAQGSKNKTNFHYKVTILYLECQLTDPSIQFMDHFAHIHILNNGIRVLLNMVPGFINVHKLTSMNWLQPLEVLGGRSLVQLLIGNKNLREHLENEVLSKRYARPLFKSFIKDFKKENSQPKGEKADNQHQDKQYQLESIRELKLLIKPMLTSSQEMNPDFSYRNAIHDCLDCDNPLLTKEYLKELLMHLQKIEVTSLVTKEIMQGLLPRFLNEKCKNEEFGFLFKTDDNSGNSLFINTINYPNMPMSSNQDLHVEYELDFEYLYPESRFQNVVERVYKRINQPQHQNSQSSEPKISDKEFSYPVKHFYIDWRHAFFQARLQVVLDYYDQEHTSQEHNSQPKEMNDQEEQEQPKFRGHEYHEIQAFFFQKDGFRNRYQISHVISLINKLYGEEIEQQRFIKLLIQDQFLMSKRITHFQLVVFIFGYLIPLFYQMQQHQDNFGAVLRANIICLLTQSFFLYLEYQQINKKEKFLIYISEPENMIDFSQVVLYFVYFVLRCMNASEQVVPYLQVNMSSYDDYYNWNPSVIQKWINWVIIHTLLIVIAFFKLMVFLEASPYFQKLVHMIPQVLIQISQFIIFMFLFMVLNTLLFNIAGISITRDNPYDEDPDYVGISMIFATFIQNFRNSIGDLHPPKYYFWIRGQNDHQLSVAQYFMISYAWILFLYNEVFMLIILLNFLIAIIEGTYLKIIARQEITEYNSMCFLNIDSAIFYDYIRESRMTMKLVNLLTGHNVKNIENPSKIFYVVASQMEKMQGSNRGIVKQVIKHIDDKTYRLKEDVIKEKKIYQRYISQQHKELLKNIRSVKQETNQRLLQIKGHQDNIDVSINKIQTQLDKENKMLSHKQEKKGNN